LVAGVVVGAAALVGGVALASPSMPTRSASDQGEGVAAAVVALTNAERQEAGCAQLEVDERLAAAARAHAADMAEKDYLDHTSQDGRGVADRIRAAGYPTPGGENIARGQGSATEVVQAWMGSPSHKHNILDCTFTTIGVGYAPDGDYWVQDFGR
jgi:uncharacterized protein YkwD